MTAVFMGREMAIKTEIEWVDSSVNLAMGCDGCELYSPLRQEQGRQNYCYAFFLTRRYAGQRGWPVSFDTPALFTERIETVRKWADLTGEIRIGKPWMNGLPRHIFHGDMGDYFTESLPEDWLLPHIDALAAMPHVHVFLTKRPLRMAQVFRLYGGVPRNFKLGVSVTNRTSLRRAAELVGGVGKMTGRLFLSVEPLIESVCGDSPFSLDRVLRLEALQSSTFQVIVGGESGPNARPFDIAWAEEIKLICDNNDVAFFMKQLGSNPKHDGKKYLVGGKGSLLIDFPRHLRVRQMR